MAEVKSVEVMVKVQAGITERDLTILTELGLLLCSTFMSLTSLKGRNRSCQWSVVVFLLDKE